MSERVSSMFKFLQEIIAASLTANTIMTSRDELCVFKPNDKISQVLVVMDEKNYNVAPLDENGVLERFVERETLRKKDPSLACNMVAEKISVKHVISEQTRIEKLLSLFNQQDFFFVIGQKEITGMVTYADLNKRAVKVLFYLLISELETRLLHIIKQRFPRVEDCLDKLNLKQREDLEKTFNETKKGDTDVSIEQYLQTSHIMTIISKDASLRSQLGFSSRKQAEKTLNPLVDLRNKTMHQRTLIIQKAEVGDLKEKYDILLELIRRLS